jgi:hypothetical protein
MESLPNIHNISQMESLPNIHNISQNSTVCCSVSFQLLNERGDEPKFIGKASARDQQSGNAPSSEMQNQN